MIIQGKEMKIRIKLPIGRFRFHVLNFRHLSKKILTEILSQCNSFLELLLMFAIYQEK